QSPPRLVRAGDRGLEDVLPERLVRRAQHLGDRGELVPEGLRVEIVERKKTVTRPKVRRSDRLFWVAVFLRRDARAAGAIRPPSTSAAPSAAQKPDLDPTPGF